MTKYSTNNYETIPYKAGDIVAPIMVRFENDNVWLSKAQMADLFQTTKNAILYHINNIYQDKELEPQATTKEILVVQNEGNREVTRKLPVFSLDMIISVGFRVNSKRAVQFRQWANEHIKNIMLRGYSVQNPPTPQPDSMGLQIQQTLLQSQQLIMAMGKKFQIALDIIDEMKPKADFCQQVLDANDCVTTSVIAKDLGMSAVTLNQLLHEMGIQYKKCETWMLYADWQDKGLVDYRTHYIEGCNKVKQQMVWTQKGRAWIVNMLERGASPREALRYCTALTNPVMSQQMLLVFE